MLRLLWGYGSSQQKYSVYIPGYVSVKKKSIIDLIKGEYILTVLEQYFGSAVLKGLLGGVCLSEAKTQGIYYGSTSLQQNQTMIFFTWFVHRA